MKNNLEVVVGQYSNKGRKDINQDFHDLNIPTNHLLTTKGIAIALADGISSSNVSQVASKTSVISFLQDYYATSESWSVAKSTSTIIQAINSWLYSQNKQSQYHYDKDKGYVCTFSSIVLKSTTAYINHIGDTRIYQIRNKKEKLLTTDHRTWISNEKSYLTRAIGIDTKINIDHQELPLEVNDIFMLVTDGVYEFVDFKTIHEVLDRYQNDLDTVAKIIVENAYKNGSDDNLTVQFIKIKKLPEKDIKEIHQHLDSRPIPHILESNEVFDGYKVLQELNHTSRSHVYLVLDIKNDKKVVMKIPSIEHRDDEKYLESFILEEWIAKRVNHINIVEYYDSGRKSNYLYQLYEYIEGQTLEQWMQDNPNPPLDKVRNIVNQISKALYSFHKLEMLYKDLRPANIMIDKHGTIKIIDFGAIAVKGINEIDTFYKQENLLGTCTYSAPEYFRGDLGSTKSDQFSLGVIVYQILSGELPYGTSIARTSTKTEQKKLKYKSLYPKYPIWIDETLRKSLQIDSAKRYSQLSEFIYDLNNPNAKYLHKTKPPLIERDPVKFWKWLNVIQLFILVYLLGVIN